MLLTCQVDTAGHEDHLEVSLLLHVYVVSQPDLIQGICDKYMHTTNTTIISATYLLNASFTSSHLTNLCLLHLSMKFVCLLAANGTFSTNRLYCAIQVRSISCRAGGQYKSIMQLNKERINKPRLQRLFSLGFIEMIPRHG